MATRKAPLSWWVRRLLRKPADSRLLAGALDTPGPEHGYSHVVRVRGWAVEAGGAAVTISIEAGGRTVAEPPVELPRPDVAARWNQAPGSERSGFDTLVRASSLPDRPTSWLIVRARAGAASRVIGLTRLSRAGAGGGSLPRWAYGDVWNGESGDVGSARVAVCGTAEDDEYVRSGASTAADIVEQAGVTPESDVVELGCGTGRIGVHLAPRCRHWTGADVSANMLAHTRAALAGRANVALFQLNGYDLEGLGDRSADVVYCSGVMMHMDEWERYRYIRDARRVLRPGGRLYVDGYDLTGDEGWNLFLGLEALDPAARPPNVSRSSTPDELRTFVERAGYTGIRWRRSGVWISVFAVNPA